MNKLLLILLTLLLAPLRGMESGVVTLSVVAHGMYAHNLKRIHMSLGQKDGSKYLLTFVRRQNNAAEEVYVDKAFPIAKHLTQTAAGYQTQVILKDFHGSEDEEPLYNNTVVMSHEAHVKLPLAVVVTYNEMTQQWSVNAHK